MLMRRELHEQPDLLGQVARALDASAASLRPPTGTRVWAGGCGDSLFAAEALARHFRTAGYKYRAASAAEMLWDDEIAQGDAVIALSISGSTRRTVEALGKARDIGARTIAITINSDSALSKAADETLKLPYEPISRAIPHGLDYHVTLLALAALATELSSIDPGELFAETTRDVMMRATASAAKLDTSTRYFLLGGGAAARGTSAFAAAKLHEAGGLPAFSCEAENFGHGAQFMLKPGDFVGLFGSGGPADARTQALGDGLRRLGCHVVEAGFEPPDAPLAPLRAALRGGLEAQALCLAVAERFGLNVLNPAGTSGADGLQKDWFSWQA